MLGQERSPQLHREEAYFRRWPATNCRHQNYKKNISWHISCWFL